MSPRAGRLPERPLRIVVVDDELDAAWTLAKVLKSALECEVAVAAEGAQAVDIASGMRPDVVLMDISMPGIDGLEAARVLRTLFTPVTVPRLIAVTGLPASAHPVILEAGFDVVLGKPLDLAALVDLLRMLEDEGAVAAR